MIFLLIKCSLQQTFSAFSLDIESLLNGMYTVCPEKSTPEDYAIN